MARVRFPRYAYNLLTIGGAAVAAITAVTMLVLLIADSAQHNTNPYLGIVVYMVLPPVLILGLLVIPLGMWRKKRHIQRTGEDAPPQWPYVDLNKATHRNAFFVFVFGTVFFALLSVVGGYQAFHFTESVEFCGTTCHTVMKPEYTAYQNSPHARVACTKCHVGPGADWYAKSKLAGAYQVYAVAMDIYPRPIETPIKNLRPAREVCEQCHWPEKFFGNQQRQFEHFMYDEENTPWPITMVLKTGGGDPVLGRDVGGIHWHVNPNIEIDYIARDHERMDIPWVRVVDKRSGEEIIYQDEDDPLTADEIAAAKPRVMDCVDCHNRPSHNYHAPDYLIDQAIVAGDIDRSLPEVKLACVEAMDGDWETEDEALDAIAGSIYGFYEEDYPDVLDAHRAAVDSAVTATRTLFANNMFPEMKVKWSAYPDHIGHMVFPGCMRCHNGEHVSEDGGTITRECSACHTILAQGSGERFQMAEGMQGIEFVHPEDIGEAWREDNCHDCHEGIQP